MNRELSLDELVERARNHKSSPTEKRNQRISLILGLRGRDSTLTREKVEELLDESGALPARRA